MSPPTPPDETRVIVVGGGLAGCLAAILLSRLPTAHVTLLEYRPDPRATAAPSGRSINLALSTRGLTALCLASLADAVRAHGVPMRARRVHPRAGPGWRAPYGRAAEALLSVSRARLNVLLLGAAEAAGVVVRFGERVREVRACEGGGEVLLEGGGVVRGGLVVGADGTYSRVRAGMVRAVRGFDEAREHVPAGYMELRIGAEGAARGGLERDVLHVWPRGERMLIALPNADGSFTATLFMDDAEFASVRAGGRAAVAELVDGEFGGVREVMPDVVEQVLCGEVGVLVTVRCAPHAAGCVVLVGDAAHAIVPFFGQGCNAAFEDCRLLYQALLARGGLPAREAALRDYARARKPDVDAIARLAVEHYHDMATGSASLRSRVRRSVELLLQRAFPGLFVPLYGMVTFSNVPYSAAVARAARQDRVLSRGLGAVFLVGVGAAVALGVAAAARDGRVRAAAGALVVGRTASHVTEVVLGAESAGAEAVRALFKGVPQKAGPVTVRFQGGKPSVQWTG